MSCAWPSSARAIRTPSGSLIISPPPPPCPATRAVIHDFCTTTSNFRHATTLAFLLRALCVALMCSAVLAQHGAPLVNVTALAGAARDAGNRALQGASGDVCPDGWTIAIAGSGYCYQDISPSGLFTMPNPSELQPESRAMIDHSRLSLWEAGQRWFTLDQFLAAPSARAMLDMLIIDWGAPAGDYPHARGWYSVDGSVVYGRYVGNIGFWSVARLQLASSSATTSSRPSPTASPTATGTLSSSATPGLACPSTLFRSLPRTDLVGVPLTDAPLAVPSEGACRIACCGAPGCDGYAFAFTELRFSSTASCVLLANVSAMAPNNFATSGLRRNMPSFSPTASMTMSPSPSSVIFLSPVTVTDLDGRSFYQGDPGLPHHGPITNLIDGDLATDWDPSCCGTYRLVFTLSALHSITSIRLSIWQNEFSASHVSIYDAPGGNLLRAMTWPYWNLTTIITIPHYVGDRFYLELTSRNNQVICNEVSFSGTLASRSPTASSTSAPSSSATHTASPSVSSTLTPGLNCPSSIFRALPHADLVGVVIDMITVFSQELCRIACCNGVKCQGFAFARTELRFGAGASCFLYANITQFIPSSAFSSGILESTL